jgi:hypothetical protein
LVGQNPRVTSTDTITVQPTDGGSQINHHVELEMHGLTKLAASAMKPGFEKLAGDTERGMTEVLNRLLS